MQICAHCQKPIGQLEPVYAWNEKVICGDCEKTLESVSSQRPPTTRESVFHQPTGVQLIERTSKFWKFQIVLGLLVTLIGLLLAGVGVYRFVIPPATTNWFGMGGVVTLIGIVWLVLAKAGAWWDHG